MENAIKVSVIIPVYNVEKYLRECLDSVINQSLKEIEIICVNDGSTDTSLDILNEYAKKENRIRIINKKNSGYGNTMNVGIEAAKGEYINFLESDDLIEPDMLKTLYDIVVKKDIDIIKADYFEYYGENKKLVPIELLKDKTKYNKCLEPSRNLWLFYVPMMNCLGLFKREFIIKNNIKHNETPGASHQDMGFWFQTFCFATNIYYVNKAFYKYRQDNTNSSMNTLSNENKIYCVHDEYKFVFKILKKNKNVREWAAPVFYHRFFGSSWFRYINFVDYLKPLFLHVFSEDLKFYSKQEDFTLERFSVNEKNIVKNLIRDPQEFYIKDLYNDTTLLTRQKQLKELERNINLVNTKYNNSILKIDDNIKVSVIIPVYNVEKYLKECLESIINQTLKAIEIICINDGSTDNSLNILNEFQKKDIRIKVISQDNLGQSAARNKGLNVACGQYVYFMDSDDILDINALQYCYDEMIKNNLDILYFDGEVFFDNDKLKNKYTHMIGTYKRSNSYDNVYSGLELFCKFKLENKWRVSPCMQIVNRKIIIQNNITFLNGIIYEDNLFVFKLVLNAERASHRNISFFKRRIREESTTTKSLSWKNFYGYFICYIEMLYLARKYYLTLEEEKYIDDELLAIKNSAKRILKTISKEEAEKVKFLNKFEKEYFDALFRDKDILKTNIFVKNVDYSNKAIKKIDGCFKCYKQHGLKYTIKRIWQHFTGDVR